MQIDKICIVCGTTFKVYPYRKDEAKFCGHACHAKYKFTGNKTRLGKPGNSTVFTSERVRGENNPKWVDSLPFTCENCGKEFLVKPWLARQRNGKPRFCSTKCWNSSKDFIRGATHPHYVGGPKTYRGRSWLKARLIAVERDDGTCQKCGKHIGKSIPVHHIKPFREFETEAEANQADNLICLCQSCHMKNEPHLFVALAP